jgi:hypothetical protein
MEPKGSKIALTSSTETSLSRPPIQMRQVGLRAIVEVGALVVVVLFFFGVFSWTYRRRSRLIRFCCYGESARELGRVSQLVLLHGSLVQIEHVLLSIANASFDTIFQWCYYRLLSTSISVSIPLRLSLFDPSLSLSRGFFHGAG